MSRPALDGVRAVVLDLDDTLYREHDYVRSGFGAVAHALHAAAPEHAVGDLHAALIAEWEAHGRGRTFDAVADRFGIDADPRALVAVYREHEPRGLALHPDADRALDRLARDGIPAAIVTDGHAGVQRSKLRALGLLDDPRIAHAVLSDELGTSKPDPRPYRAALAALGDPPPATTVYVGDDPHKDFVGARALGMRTLRVCRDHGDHARTRLGADLEADATIPSLDALWPA